MNFLIFLSTYIIPFILLYVIGYGLLKKQNVYENFIKGAVDGFHTVIKIMPTLIGLMVAVGILRASGFLDMLSGVLGHFLQYVGFPAELVPVTIVRMFSSSAATGLVLDIFKEHGPDSQIGTMVSIMMGCTDDGLILGINREYLQMRGFEVCPYFFANFSINMLYFAYKFYSIVQYD